MSRMTKQKRIITLTTDFGNKDGYAGVMHGVILSHTTDVVIVDLTHQIPPQNIFAAAFLLEKHSSHFPISTIHVAVVDPEVGGDRAILLAASGGQFYLAPDNGLLAFLKKRSDTRFYQATDATFWQARVSQTFHGRDVFAPLAAQLACGLKIDRAFSEIDVADLKGMEQQLPVIAGNEIHGVFVYCDHFGNLITNIHREHLPVDREIIISCGLHKITGLSSAYADKNHGELLAIINSFDHLELAVNNGRADTFLPNYTKETITIKWHDF